MHQLGQIVIFDTTGEDEQFFADWIEANPVGYVANLGRGANRKSPVKLHETVCIFMRSEAVAQGGFIGEDFYKACSLDGQVLAQWVQQGYTEGHWGEPSDDRRFCHPGLIPQH